MSKSKRNMYAQKAKQKSLMGLGSTNAAVATKGDFKNTMAFTGRDILIGGLGGSLAGALAGRSSFLIGIAVTGAGHYMGSGMASMFGVGMMASGGYQTISGMNGTERDGFEGMKERFTNFQNNLKRQLFLDKIIKPKAQADTESTNGVEGVDYYRHSDDVNGLDYTEANRIERQISDSARQFEARHNMSGAEDDVSGVEGTDGVEGVEGIEDRLI